MRTVIWGLLLLSIFTVHLEGAEVYKWVDENGVVHFTDEPPKDRQSTEIELKEDYSQAQAQTNESVYSEVIEQQQLRRERRTQELEQESIARKAKLAEESESQANCSRAIHYLNILSKQCPVFYDGAGVMRGQCPGIYYAYEGERTYIDDGERQELINYYSGIATECEKSKR